MNREQEIKVLAEELRIAFKGNPHFDVDIPLTNMAAAFLIETGKVHVDIPLTNLERLTNVVLTSLPPYDGSFSRTALISMAVYLNNHRVIVLPEEEEDED